MKGRGWHGESRRHGLARRGIRSVSPAYGERDPGLIEEIIGNIGSFTDIEDEIEYRVYRLDHRGVEMSMECHPGYCYLYHLYLPPELRGKKIGIALLQEAEEIARSEGIELIMVSIGTEAEDPSGLFYHLGYEDGLPFPHRIEGRDGVPHLNFHKNL